MSDKQGNNAITDVCVCVFVQSCSRQLRATERRLRFAEIFCSDGQPLLYNKEDTLSNIARQSLLRYAL